MAQERTEKTELVKDLLDLANDCRADNDLCGVTMALQKAIEVLNNVVGELNRKL